MNLPRDDFMLLSLVNTKLRDGYPLEDFCADYSCTEEEICTRLAKIGYNYDKARNTFSAI